MEEQKETTAGGNSGSQANHNVTLKVTVGDNTTSKDVRFNTPVLLKEVQALDDSASVEIVAARTLDGKEVSQTMLKGTKAEAVEALEKSIVKPNDLVAQFQHLVRFLVDHSTLKAVGVELVCTDDNGDTAGAGFVSTSQDCTVPQAIALVNCGDANMDEFVTKAKLSVPGRGGASEKGTIVMPTAAEAKKFG